jgi:hypothetical protein
VFREAGGELQNLYRIIQPGGGGGVAVGDR